MDYIYDNYFDEEKFYEQFEFWFDVLGKLDAEDPLEPLNILRNIIETGKIFKGKRTIKNDKKLKQVLEGENDAEQIQNFLKLAKPAFTDSISKFEDKFKKINATTFKNFNVIDYYFKNRNILFNEFEIIFDEEAWDYFNVKAKKMSEREKIGFAILFLYALYNLGELRCNNTTEIFSFEDIAEIDPKLIISLSNGNCYDINNLLEYLIANKDENVDPIIKAEKNKITPLWKDNKEKQNILTHPSLNKELLKKYNEMLKEKKAEEFKFVKEIAKDISLLDKIAEVGSICLNDDTANWSENPDPNTFQKSTKAIGDLIETLQKRQDKKSWLGLTLYNKNLQKILDAVKSTCIHGIGGQLLQLYLAIYYNLKFIHSIDIELSSFFMEIDDNTYITYQVVGLQNGIYPAVEQSYSMTYDVFGYTVTENNIGYERFSGFRYITIDGMSNNGNNNNNTVYEFLANVNQGFNNLNRVKFWLFANKHFYKNF
jgi:hypothetical protein